MRIEVKGTIVSNDEAWIYDFFGMENTCPKNISDAINAANGEPIDVYIDSGGGDIFAGSNIYSLLRDYKGSVKIHVIGLAASAASVIACAATSDISPTAMLMVHNVSASARGDYHDMDKTSDTLQKANHAVASAYIAKTGMSEKEALDMMEKETWLTAADAVEKGLIDSISESQNLKMVATISNVLPHEVIDKVRNMIKAPIDKNKSDFLYAKLKLLKMKGGKNYEI